MYQVGPVVAYICTKCANCHHSWSGTRYSHQYWL